MPPAEPPRDGWLHPDVAPGTSLIAGTGLLARARIPAGTAVARVTGRLVSSAELEGLHRAGSGYVDSVVVAADVHLVVSGASRAYLGNHSCEPNLGWTDEFTLSTLREVVPGEELASDYATGSADPDFVMWCHCETYRCRQVIEGTDWQIPQLQQRYAGQFVPYLHQLLAR